MTSDSRKLSEEEPAGELTIDDKVKMSSEEVSDEEESKDELEVDDDVGMKYVDEESAYPYALQAAKSLDEDGNGDNLDKLYRMIDGSSEPESTASSK